MAGAELSLAVLGAADVCFRYGRDLIETYKAIKVADTDIREKTLVIEATWTKISLQLSVLKRIRNSLDETYRDLQDDVLQVLAQKLEAATLQLSKADRKHNRNGDMPRGFLFRSKYVMLVRRSLEQAIQDLKDWQGTFDPTWILITTCLPDHIIGDELALKASSSPLSTTARFRDTVRNEAEPKGVFLPPDRLAAAKLLKIPYSTSQLVRDCGEEI